MRFEREIYSDVEVEVSEYKGIETTEIHAMFKPTSNDWVNSQMERILKSAKSFMQAKQMPENALVFVRLFVSDYTNQADDIDKAVAKLYNEFGKVAVSIVEQAPLNGSKISAWAYFVHNKKVDSIKKEIVGEHGVAISHNGYEHHWDVQVFDHSVSNDPFDQTKNIFLNYEKGLNAHEINVADNCIRTWFFVRDVDVNYGGVVKARNEYFDVINLTRDTHYIASTGINGCHFDSGVCVLFDAYSIKGIEKEQVRYLQAPDHLNPTHEYGVAFERATCVKYGDRQHVYISGTASIDNKGEIVHPNNIEGQVNRTLENIQALLNSADAKLEDMSHLIIYLRDISDYQLVKNMIELQMPGVPKVMVHAPVCRPGWLIEIEGIAINRSEHSTFKNF